MRPVGAEALEAGDDRVQALAELADQALGLDRLDAGGAVARVGAERHLPALPAAGGDAHLLQGQRHQAGGDVLAGGDHGVVLAGVEEERGLADPADELVGLAGHGGDDDGDVVAALDLALDLGGRVADAVEVGDAGAAEFHHQTGHGPWPAVWVGRALLSGGSGGLQAAESGSDGRGGVQALKRLGKSGLESAGMWLERGLPFGLPSGSARALVRRVVHGGEAGRRPRSRHRTGSRSVRLGGGPGQAGDRDAVLDQRAGLGGRSPRR